MDFSYKQPGIVNLFGTNRNQLIVPRYQRDYSWTTEQAKVLFQDIILNFKNSTSESSEYFFGTVILNGKPEDYDQKLEIIDGQQRITTIYIMLAVMNYYLDSIPEENKTAVSKKLQDIIYGRELFFDNKDLSSKIPSLLVESSNKFFNIYLFPVDREQDKLDPTVINRSDQSIKDVFDYFVDQLKEENLKISLGIDDQNIGYDNLLNIVHNQLEKFKVTIISTSNYESANSIFESLNSKGVPLDQVDLIKNKLFSELKKTDPYDHAQEEWSKFKKNLETKVVGNSTYRFVDLNTFMDYFWRANYHKTTQNKIYSKFMEKLNKNQIDTTIFLKQLVEYSSEFNSLNGDDSKFIISLDNKEEISNYMNLLVDSLKIKQAYPLLMQIVHAFNLKLIKENNVLKTLKFMANFHIIFNEISTLPGNRLQYPKFANWMGSIIHSDQKDEVKVTELNHVIMEMRKQLKKILPSESELKSILDERIQEVEFTYTLKGDTSNNKKTRRILYNYTVLQNGKVSKDANIEHIIPDNIEDSTTWSIGNLIFLDKKVNGKLKNNDISSKIETYKNLQKTNDIQILLKSNYFNLIKAGEEEKAFENRTRDMITTIYNSLT